MLQDVQMHHDLRASVAQVLGVRQYLYKWAAMPHEGDSMLNVDYLKCLNTAQLLELLEDEERMRETVRINSKVPNKYTVKNAESVLYFFGVILS